MPEETNNCIACGLNHILTNMHFYEYYFNDLFLISQHVFSLFLNSLYFTVSAYN